MLSSETRKIVLRKKKKKRKKKQERENGWADFEYGESSLYCSVVNLGGAFVTLLYCKVR